MPKCEMNKPIECPLKHTECDECEFLNYVDVSHPGGGMSTIEKYFCDEGYWEEDF